MAAPTSDALRNRQEKLIVAMGVASFDAFKDEEVVKKNKAGRLQVAIRNALNILKKSDGGAVAAFEAEEKRLGVRIPQALRTELEKLKAAKKPAIPS